MITDSYVPKRFWERLSLPYTMHKYSKHAVHRPYTCIMGILALCILLSGITIGGGFMKLNGNKGGEWDVKGDPITEKGYTWDIATKDLQDAASPTERSRTDYYSSISFVYRSKSGDSLLNPTDLETLREVENILLLHPNYPKFCKLDYSVTPAKCVKPSSVLAHIYGIDPATNGYPALTAAQVQANVDAFKIEYANAVAAAGTDPSAHDTKTAYDQFFSKSYPEPTDIRTRVWLGTPIAGLDNGQGQDATYSNLTKSVEKSLLKLIGAKQTLLRTAYMWPKRTVGNVKLLWFSNQYYDKEFGAAPLKDFGFVIFSLIAVYSFMYYHTRSLLVVVISIIMNVLCFPVAHFIFRVIFQVQWFNIIHLLLMFVLLGISADGYFVVVDAFSQSGTIPGVADSLESRISYMSQRSSNALLVTSLTTCASFFIIAVSRIMPIRSFGIFSGWLIFVLYFLTIFLLPPIMVIWSRHFEDTPCCPLCRSGELVSAKRHEGAARRAALALPTTAPITITSPPTSVYTSDVEGGMVAAKAGSDAASVSSGRKGRHSGELSDEALSKLDVQEDKLRLMERFMHGPMYNFTKRFRYAIVAIFTAVLIVGIVLTSRLQPPTKTDVWLPKTHMLQAASDRLGNAKLWLAVNDDNFDSVYLLWGCKGMNTKGTNQWDAEDRGTLVWNNKPTFDPTTPAAQAYIQKACSALKTTPCTAQGCTALDGQRMLTQEVTCWSDGFDQWLSDKYPTDTSKRMGSLVSDDFLDELNAWRAEPGSTANRDYFYTLGMFPNPSYPSALGSRKYTLKYVALESKSTLQIPAAMGKVTSVIDAYTALLDNLEPEAPVGMKNGYAVDDGTFGFSSTQGELISAAREELGIIFPIAFFVINLAIGNLWVAIVTLMSIAGIVTITMGIGVSAIMGWSLGTAESIVIVMLVGYAMDYVLYITKAYVESKHHTRDLKVREALTHLGVSVWAGTVSNILAAVFLWGTVFLFFQKFAFLIVFATPVAFLWSVVFLPAALQIMGPEGDSGEWRVWFANVKGWFNGKSSRASNNGPPKVLPDSN